MSTSDYTNTEIVRRRLFGDSGMVDDTRWDVDLRLICTGVSRFIDRHTGRRFYTVHESRAFTAERDGTVVIIDDLFPSGVTETRVEVGQRIEPITIPSSTPMVKITYVTATALIAAGTNIDISADGVGYTVENESGGAVLGDSSAEFIANGLLSINRADGDVTTDDPAILDKSADITYVNATTFALAADAQAGDVLAIMLVVLDGQQSVSVNWSTYGNYELWPRNAVLDNRPYTQVWAYGDKFPSGRGLIRITGDFGFSASAPADVAEIATLLAMKLFKRREVIFRASGKSSLGVVRHLELNKSDPELEPMLNALPQRWIAL